MGAWYQRHRWVLDPAAMALLSLVFAALGFHGIWGSFFVSGTELSPWSALVFAVPACALALGKRRHPMIVLVLVSVLFIADIVTVGGIGTLVVLLDVLWTAVFVAGPRTRRILSWLLIGAAIVLFVTAMITTGGDFPAAFVISLQFGAIFGTDYWWAVAVSQAHELAELHRQRAEEVERQALQERETAVRRERESMARELHDTIAGHVMAMAIRSEAALSVAPDERTDRAALQAVRDAGLDAHAALRTMIAVLRDGESDLAVPLGPADWDRAVDGARRSGLVVHAGAPPLGLSAPVEQAVLRIVREALTNCERHAAGAVVEVEVDQEPGWVRVAIESRGGSPRAQATGSGWGLSMLGERVRALEGTFSAGPIADGWSVRAAIPDGRQP
ncbi:sensor histidine kinase [Microbacterium sp. NPDC056234]|uniref:sensor histidine kinase n=1 Tax=Microbacterium sp. NPDC056234 TaxID=3345757 RepID=UPI0035DF3183